MVSHMPSVDTSVYPDWWTFFINVSAETWTLYKSPQLCAKHQTVKESLWTRLVFYDIFVFTVKLKWSWVLMSSFVEVAQ